MQSLTVLLFVVALVAAAPQVVAGVAAIGVFHAIQQVQDDQAIAGEALLGAYRRP